MSGRPTTAGQLLALAAEELHQLSQRTGQHVPEQLAAAWPAFLRHGDHLAAILNPQADPVTSLWPERQPGRPAPHVPPVDPDPRLQRAADLLGAAGDLISTRTRTQLTTQDAAADNAQAMRCLVNGAVQVAQALGPLPDWAHTAVDAVVAARTWTRGMPRTGAGSGAGTLHDARTAPTPPAPGTELADQLTSTIETWRRAAVAITHAASPSSEDLQDCGRTAGQLLALSQVLLRSYGAEAGPRGAVEHVYLQIRTAGRAWNATTDSWATTTAPGPRDDGLLEAGTQLHAAVAVAARTAGPSSSWANVPTVRGRLTGPEALATANQALSAVQDVAEAHAPLVGHLAAAGDLYAPARHLEATPERLDDRLRGRWLPVPREECLALTDGYRHLVDVSAAARLPFIRLTDGPPVKLPFDALPKQYESLLDPAPGTQPSPASTLAIERWDQTLRAVAPRLAGDPHYPALAAALDRIELSGEDVTQALEAAHAKPLPNEHAARALHYRLIEVCPAALTRSTIAPGPARPRAQSGTSASTSARPQPSPPAPRR